MPSAFISRTDYSPVHAGGVAPRLSADQKAELAALVARGQTSRNALALIITSVMWERW